MARRPPLAVVVGAALVLVAPGCGGSSSPVATVTPSAYIAAVEDLLQPPAQLASSISERADGGGPAPRRERLQGLVDAARARLAAFRGLRLGDPVLAAQRDRLAAAYARMIPHMRRAADALAPAAGAGSAVAADGPASVLARASLSSETDPFLSALRTLPSAAASPSSR